VYSVQDFVVTVNSDLWKVRGVLGTCFRDK
jgi:hypothetical protein